MAFHCVSVFTNPCRYWLFSIILIALLFQESTSTFYLPGVNPQSFAVGDAVKLKANSLTSHKKLIPFHHYSLAFCSPLHGPRQDHQNLGEYLQGDRIVTTFYNNLRVKQNVYCQQLCVSNLGRKEIRGMTPNRVVKAIRNGYHQNWIVDNMDVVYRRTATTKEEEDQNGSNNPENNTAPLLHYGQGFPIGFLGDNDGTRFGGGGDRKEAKIYNHVNIYIMYHAIENELSKYRIVGFEVEPFSIKHEIDDISYSPDPPRRQQDDDYTYVPYDIAKLKNPIPSCDPNIPPGQKQHTNPKMLSNTTSMPASGLVLFTYDVIWIEKPDTYWATRWNVYLESGGVEDTPRLQQYIITDRLLVLVFVVLVVVVIGKVRCDYGYQATQQEQDNDKTKAVKNDTIAEKPMASLSTPLLSENDINTENQSLASIKTFNGSNDTAKPTTTTATPTTTAKTPFVIQSLFHVPNSPVIFAVALGSGIQLLCTMLVVALLAGAGFLSAPRRGSLVMAWFLLYCTFGCVGGFVTGRVHRLFHGSDKLPMYALARLPGAGFLALCCRNMVAWLDGSTLAMPVESYIAVILLLSLVWFPSAAIGLYLGYHSEFAFGGVMELMTSKLNWLKEINPSVFIAIFFFSLFMFGEEIFFLIANIVLLMFPLGIAALLLWIVHKSGMFAKFEELVPSYSIGILRPTLEGAWSMSVPVAIGMLAHIRMIVVADTDWLPSFGIVMIGLLIFSKDATWPHIYSGVLPYAVLHPYYRGMYGALWGRQYYDPSGPALLIALALYLATIGVVSMTYTYHQVLQVQKKNQEEEEEPYRFEWWYSFGVAGSNAVYFLFQPGLAGPEPDGLVAVLYYCGVMLFLVFGIFLLSGAWGTCCSVWFIRRVFKLQSRESGIDDDRVEFSNMSSNSADIQDNDEHAAEATHPSDDVVSGAVVDAAADATNGRDDLLLSPDVGDVAEESNTLSEVL